MSSAVRIVVEENSITAEARRTAREMALAMGMDQDGAEHVAIVATEACTNLLKHATRGEILLQIATEVSEAPPSLELAGRGSGSGDGQSRSVSSRWL